jgi:hypothetical protein
MSKLITQCPSCGDGTLKVTKIDCRKCETKFEGDFQIPPLLRLREEDLNFVEDFVRSEGSLKEMAKKMNLSYPTVRNHLTRVIEELNALTKDKEKEREKILSALANGKISAKEAARKLEDV